MFLYNVADNTTGSHPVNNFFQSFLAERSHPLAPSFSRPCSHQTYPARTRSHPVLFQARTAGLGGSDR